MLFVLALASPGQIQFLGRRLLRLLDETVEPNDLARGEHEQCPRDAMRQAGAQLPNPVAQVVHQRPASAL